MTKTPEKGADAGSDPGLGSDEELVDPQHPLPGLERNSLEDYLEKYDGKYGSLIIKNVYDNMQPSETFTDTYARMRREDRE